MPSKKVSVVIILCIGVIISIWLLTRAKISNLTMKSPGSATAVLVRNIENTNDDWKKLFTAVDAKTQETVIDVTPKNTSTFDETTLTAQISQDFMSEYIKLKGSGQSVTQEDIANLAQKVLLNPKYSRSIGAAYVASNIRIDDFSDKDEIALYKKSIKNLIQFSLNQSRYDPATIVTEALNTKNFDVLKKLDPSIAASKFAINNLLTISVPKNAVTAHLMVLNSISNILADLESMRVLESDPVRSFSAIYSYNSHITSLVSALNLIGKYIIAK